LKQCRGTIQKSATRRVDDNDNNGMKRAVD